MKIQHSSDIVPFITAFDPASKIAGSVDPLGALQSYGALADLLLPGITTITNRSRYLSMICAALLNSTTHHKSFPHGSMGLVLRRKSIKKFERLWALACVAAREKGAKDAADGIRGITYAESAYRTFMDKDYASTKYDMLQSQERAGGIGTYWSALIAADLIDEKTGMLTTIGWDLANTFPMPDIGPDKLKNLADPNPSKHVTIDFDELGSWGKVCHLTKARKNERTCLIAALRADDRRASVADAFIKLRKRQKLPDYWDITWLNRLKDALKEIPVGRKLGLPAVIDGIVVVERFHEAALTVFETLLWWATMKPGEPIHDLHEDKAFIRDVERTITTADKLAGYYKRCDNKEAKESMVTIVNLASDILKRPNVTYVFEELLHRHKKVQEGKIYGGVRKREWITFDGNGFLRPAPRFQVNERPGKAYGRYLTHPYRLEQFVHMLRENNVID